jgi:hypothetical protein
MNLELRSARGYEVPVPRLAADELRHWIKEITGADLPILLTMKIGKLALGIGLLVAMLCRCAGFAP